VTKTVTSYREVLQEHRELHRRTAELREMIARAQAETAALEHRLLDLHRQLTAHFKLEEDTGLFRTLPEQFPEASHQLERLEAEHALMLEEARSLVDAAMAGAESESAMPVSELCERTGALLDHIDRHEREETELLQRSWSQDLGEVE